MVNQLLHPKKKKKDVTLGEEEEKWWKIRISRPNSDPQRISSNPCCPFQAEGNLKEKSEKSVSTSEPKEICLLNYTWKSFTPFLSLSLCPRFLLLVNRQRNSSELFPWDWCYCCSLNNSDHIVWETFWAHRRIVLPGFLSSSGTRD